MSGARMNQNYPRVGGVRNDLPENFEAMCKRSIEHFLEKLENEYPKIFHESKVFRMRTEGVGTLSAADAINWGVTGPNLRACGVNVDLRRLDPYETTRRSTSNLRYGKMAASATRTRGSWSGTTNSGNRATSFGRPWRRCRRRGRTA